MGLPYEDLLKPVSEDQPSGPKLAADERYLEVDRLLRGTPERTEILPSEGPSDPVRTRVIPAEDPDWLLVRDKCIGLLKGSSDHKGSHDLVIATWYTLAMLQLDGFAGLAEGLGAIRWLVEREWDSVHPQLDETDQENPAWERMKVLNRLASPPSREDKLRVCARVRDTTIVETRNAGSLTLRLISIAAGQEAPPEGTPPVDIASVKADADTEALRRVSGDLQVCLEHLAGIDRVFRGDREANIPGKVRSGQEPQLGRLRDVLGDVRKHVLAELGRRAGAAGGEPDNTGDSADEHPVVSPAALVAAPPGEVRSAADARRALDKVVEYFLKHEPSSPVWVYAKAASQLIDRRIDSLVDLKVFETNSGWSFVKGLADGQTADGQ